MQSCIHNEKARAFSGTGQASTTDYGAASGCAIAPLKFRKGCILKERTAVGGNGINGGQQRTIKRRIDPRLATGNGCRHQKQISDLDIIFNDHICKTGGIRDGIAIFKHSRQMHGQSLRGIAIAFLNRIPGTGTTGKVWEERAITAFFIGFDYDRKSLLHVKTALLGDHAGGTGSPEPDTTLFFNSPKCTYFQILLRMRDCDAPRLGRVTELVMASCRLHFEPSIRLDPFDNFPALHQPSVVDALYIHTIAHKINGKVCIYVYCFSLTTIRNRRMVQPIGGINLPRERRNSLSRRLAVTLVAAIFVSGFRAQHLAYGGKACFPVQTGEHEPVQTVSGDKTPFGGKPRACLVTGFYLPAASVVVESLSGGVLKRYHEGFNMTILSISADQFHSIDRAAVLLDNLHDALHGIHVLCEGGHQEQAGAIALILSDASYQQAEKLQDAIAAVNTNQAVIAHPATLAAGE